MALLTESLIAVFIATIVGVVLATAISNAYRMEKSVRDLKQMQSAQVLSMMDVKKIIPDYNTVLYDDSNLTGDSQRLALFDSTGSGDQKYAAISLVDKNNYKPAASGILGVYYSASGFSGQDWDNTVFTPIRDLGTPVADRLQFTVPSSGSAIIINIKVVIGSEYNEQTISILSSRKEAFNNIEDNKFSDRFGICYSHFILLDAESMDKQIAAMKKANIKWTRIALAWADLEPQRDQWTLSKTDMALNKLQANDINVLGIIGGSTDWANGGQPGNVPPTDMEAWKNYVSKITLLYKDKISAWEIWNEQNTHAFWNPPDANSYVSLVKITTPIIRDNDPDGEIVMGGMAGVGYDYLNAAFQLGVADYIDAFAYHPYPETIYFWSNLPHEEITRQIVKNVRNDIAKYTTKDIDIWLTETGWPTGGWLYVVSEENQANYMLRTMINYADIPEVKKVFIYNLQDETVGTLIPEWYGILRQDFTEKPSFQNYMNFENTFGEAVSTTPNTITVTCTNQGTACSNPGVVKKYAFKLNDDSLLVALWVTNNDFDDSLVDAVNLKINDSAYNNPSTYDMMTGQASATPNVFRDGEDKINISNIIVSKNPVVLKFSAR